MRTKLNRFLHYLKVEKGYSQGTIQAYQLDIGQGLIPFLHQRGKFGVEEVTKDDIRAYLDYLAVEKINSGVTRARKLAAIKSFFNYLVENEGLETNPAACIRGPKTPQAAPVYLCEGECLRLLQTIAHKGRPEVKERDMAIAVLLLHTGLRVSELTSLKLSDVNLDSGQIKITRKGGKEQYLHLNCEVVKALVSYLHSRPQHMRLPRFPFATLRASAHRNDEGLLPQAQNGKFFVGTKGQNLSRTYVYSVVRRYLKLAGINKGKQGPHLLRHTFCTRLHQKGASPFVIKELAGHKSLNTTMRYVKIENREQAEALDRLQFGIATPPEA